METKDVRKEAQQCLQNLRNIADGLESMLDKYNEYWTWADFFRDMKNELIRVKDQVQKTGRILEKNLNQLREEIQDEECSQLFERIDKKRSRLESKGSEIENKADISRVAIEGENLAEDLSEVLSLFRETANLVEKIIKKTQTN